METQNGFPALISLSRVAVYFTPDALKNSFFRVKMRDRRCYAEKRANRKVPREFLNFSLGWRSWTPSSYIYPCGHRVQWRDPLWKPQKRSSFGRKQRILERTARCNICCTELSRSVFFFFSSRTIFKKFKSGSKKNASRKDPGNGNHFRVPYFNNLTNVVDIFRLLRRAKMREIVNFKRVRCGSRKCYGKKQNKRYGTQRYRFTHTHTHIC